MNVAGIFYRARRLLGNPTITVVAPISEWTLPAGYTVDESLDLITDDQGNVVDDYSSFWKTTCVDILPEDSDRFVKDATFAGVSSSGGIVFYVLAGDVETLKEAFRIRYASTDYNVSTVKPVPALRPQYAVVGCTLWT